MESILKKGNLDTEVIGEQSGFWGPFGWKKYTYLDYTASGKAIKSIETFMRREVLPHYANTHTTVSHTSLQTTLFRNEARSLIKHSVGASENDEVIFCGSGATAAVHKLIHSVSHPKSRKLVVFLGPFEHHSNILPWREAASKVIQVPVDWSTGQVDTNYLERHLKKVTRWKDPDSQLIVGCFSAGSNVTGALTDDVQLTSIMHKYGGLAFWDYASAAPHVHINMNPSRLYANKGFNVDKDAIFFSGHKLLGGPQTPGVLVVKRHLLRNPVPHGAGGGTVLFTTRNNHQYLQNVHEREEGGTPDILGSIRLGLCFRLRNIIGNDEVIQREAAYCRKILKAWSAIPQIHILGSCQNPRLPIISFMIEHLQTGFYLHHNFVVALLNDLFGIQCRGGCMCAGPYAQELLGIGDKLAHLYEESLKKSQSDSSSVHAKCGAVLKPGFVRISVSFETTPEQIDFLIKAVKLIALHGWRLLPLYKICWKTASFVCNSPPDLIVKPISLLSFDGLLIKSAARKPPGVEFDYRSCLKEAEYLMAEFKCNPEKLHSSEKLVGPLSQALLCDPKLLQLRWFLTPYESHLLQLFHFHKQIKTSRPFQPRRVAPISEGIMQWMEGSIPGYWSNVWERLGTAVEGRGAACTSITPKRTGYYVMSKNSFSSSNTSGFGDDDGESWSWSELTFL